jgi:hypothetical protein
MSKNKLILNFILNFFETLKNNLIEKNNDLNSSLSSEEFPEYNISVLSDG